MKCQELLDLLPTNGYVDVWEETRCQKIVAHIRSCSLCCRGLARLSKAVIVEDVLSCDACHAHFVAYYEATQPICKSSPLADVDVVQIAVHLGHCTACSEEYHVLVELWDKEEC